MTDEYLEQLIKSEFDAAVPDDFDKILEKCRSAGWEEKSVSAARRPENKRRGSRRAGFLAAAAMFVLLIGGGAFYQTTKLPADIIQMDVNPSIELTLNRYGKVLECQAANTDADPIVGEYNLSGQSAAQAVGKLTNALVDAGYVTDDKNAVLLSVISDSGSRAKKLANEAAAAVRSTAGDNGIDASVMTQHFSKSDELTAMAKSLGVSCGKAALIKNFEDLLPEYDAAALSKLSIRDLNILADEYDLSGNSYTDFGTVSRNGYVSVSAAADKVSAALKTAKKTVSDMTYRVSAGVDGLEYIITSKDANTLYTSIVDADTGKLIKSTASALKDSSSSEKTKDDDNQSKTDPAKPSVTKPVTTAKPSVTTKPVATPKPAATPVPAVTPKPAETDQPSTGTDID